MVPAEAGRYNQCHHDNPAAGLSAECGQTSWYPTRWFDRGSSTKSMNALETQNPELS